MPALDVFNNSAFSLTSLTSAISKADYVPQALGQIGVFERKPVRNHQLFVDRKSTIASLIPVTERGASPDVLPRVARDAIPMSTVRIARSSRVTALEVANIRAHGSETETNAVQREVADRLERIRQDFEFTFEFHRLGAVQGLVLDADGTSIVEDYWTKFGVSKPAPIALDLTNANADVRTRCHEITRAVQVASKGAWSPSAKVHALCGDEFYDNLCKNKSVRETYLHSEGRRLREGMAYGDLEFGGIVFHNYRGSDNGQLSIPTNEARFFPVGAPGVFLQAMAPADEFAPYVGTMGRELYAMTIPDWTRQAYVDVETYSYPLFVCTRPEMLLSGTGGA